MTDWFIKIVNMSISAGWMVLAVVILRPLLAKFPHWVKVLLWGLVALRLLCPLSIQSALSLIPSGETVSPDIMLDPNPSLQTGIPAINNAVNPVITHSFAPSPAASANPLQVILPVLSLIWGAGMVLMLCYMALSCWHLHRKIGTAVLLQDNIFQSEQIQTPFVLGIFRPKIYLPFRLEQQYLLPVITHEQTHIRRKDHWWKPLGFLLLTVHWFNPLIWLAYILLCRDIELACDQKVIRNLTPAQRADYSQALLCCSVQHKSIAACPLAFGEGSVKKRIQSVLRYRKPAFWMILLALMVCIAVAVCFLTNPAEETPDLSFLNYQNAVSVAASQSSLTVIYYPSAEDNADGLIKIGEVRGSDVANYLDTAQWQRRGEPWDTTLPSPGSIEFVLSDSYRITIYQKSRLAKVAYHEDIRWYRTQRDSYENAVSLALESAQSLDSASNESAEIGEPVENLTISEHNIGNGMQLRLILLNGYHFSQEETAPGGGVYDENYRGEYELSVYRGETLLSRLENDQLLPMSLDGDTLNFAPGFSFSLADYNGDGQQDFALAQWASSNASSCMLFSVDEDGNLSVLTPGQPLMVSGHTFSPLFEQVGTDSFTFAQYDNAAGTLRSYLAQWEGNAFAITAQTTLSSDPTLTPETAADFIAQTLATLTLHSDQTVSFALPDTIPVSQDENTQLTISLNATFETDPATYSVQQLLDWETDWVPGESYRGTLESQRGTLNELMLRVAFMTQTGDNTYQQYAADFLELTAPFSYEQPAGYTPASVAVQQQGSKTVLLYTFSDGKQAAVTLPLPAQLTLTPSAQSAYGLPALDILDGSTTVGTIQLYPFGTNDPQILEAIDTAANTLPMQIFSTVALANHAGYEAYQVQAFSDTGATATAQYVWQDLRTGDAAASDPWQHKDCLLGYDWTVMPYFIEIILHSGFLSPEQLSVLSQGLTLQLP